MDALRAIQSEKYSKAKGAFSSSSSSSTGGEQGDEDEDENGRSNSDRTKHIGIRYFFVKQYVDNGTMKIQHCPTLQMIADILTKPLQGELFRRLRDLLLGYTRPE